MLLILFAAVFAVRLPIEEAFQKAGKSVMEPARRRLAIDACNVQTEAECTAVQSVCAWYDNKCMTKWGVHECEAGSTETYSYTCLADTDGKYLQQASWWPTASGQVDCNAAPNMKVNLYHGLCTDIFGPSFGNGKFICDKDGSIYVDSCDEGEEVSDVWGLMSSTEQPYDSSCSADEEDGTYSQISCDSDKRQVVTQYDDDSTCKNFDMKMALTKTCRNYEIETGENGETTTYPMSIACDGANQLITLCSEDAKVITDTANPYLMADYVEVKLDTGCDCDVDDGCQKYECTADSLTIKAFSDSTCQTETKSATMPLNVMKKQSFPPAEFVDPEDGDHSFVFESKCTNNKYTMNVGSVFSSLKKSNAEKYVSPSEITQEGDTMKYNGETVTATKNEDIPTIPKHDDDPSYAKGGGNTGNNGGNSGDSSSSELIVLFGFLASIFAL